MTTFPKLAIAAVAFFIAASAHAQQETPVESPAALSTSWRALGPAYAHHFSQFGAPARGYNEKNVGIGLEYNRRDENSVGRYFAGYTVDSYFNPSIYAGTAHQLTIYNAERIRVDAGLISMLWKRTVVGTDDRERKQLVLVALPLVSIEDKKSGLGVNISFVPKIKFQGRQYTVNTLIVQASFAIS